MEKTPEGSRRDLDDGLVGVVPAERRPEYRDIPETQGETGCEYGSGSREVVIVVVVTRLD
jgi:hypothetical protein